MNALRPGFVHIGLSVLISDRHLSGHSTVAWCLRMARSAAQRQHPRSPDLGVVSNEWIEPFGRLAREWVGPLHWREISRQLARDF